MPTYAYACKTCAHRFEIVQSFSDASLTECPECGGVLRKEYGSIGVTFNGSGFYRTDSRAGDSRKGGRSDSGSKDSGSKDSGSTSSSGSKDSGSTSGSGSGGSGSSSASSAKTAAKSPTPTR